MKYYVKYGCTCETVESIVECDTLKEAEEYAYESAIESYQSFEGYHGMRDICDIAEDEFGEDLDDLTDEQIKEVESLYLEEIENDISYFTEIYDETKDIHIEAMEEGGVIEI